MEITERESATEMHHHILLVNDDEAMRKFLREKLILDVTYAVSAESTAQQALEVFKGNSFDIVIAKFSMPDMAGEEFVRQIKRIDQDCIMIALLEDIDTTIVREMARLGVYDFLVKPINIDKLFTLVKKGLEYRALTVFHHKLIQGLREQVSFLHKQNNLLTQRIEDSSRNLTRLYEDLRQTYLRTVKVLAQAIDAKDHYTHSHSENVAKCAVAIAAVMNLPLSEIELLREACELHDLGKIGVDDCVLSKPGALTPEEWEQIKRHPTTAAQILEPLTFLNGAIELIRQHHEHFDGSGYPEGRRGEDILLGARILHLADAYEAMRSARSYRTTPLTKDEAVMEIKHNKGTQFDPRVVEAFLRIAEQLQ